MTEFFGRVLDFGEIKPTFLFFPSLELTSNKISSTSVDQFRYDLYSEFHV